MAEIGDVELCGMSSEETGLEVLLQDLARVGKHDSQGGFSLDLSRSIAKFSQFRTDHPDRFLLHFFSAGVALGATRIHIQTGNFKWRLSLSCQDLNLEHFKGILPSLFQEQPGRTGIALRELALALTHLRALGNVAIGLHSRTSTLELLPHYLTVRPALHDRPGLHLEVKSRSWLQTLKIKPNLAEFRELSQLGACQRVVNGQCWPPDNEWGCQANLVIQGKAALPPLDCSENVQQTHDEEFSLVLGLYPEDRAYHLSILHRGVLFDRNWTWLLLRMRVLVVDDGLKRDLLGCKLVEDERFAKLLDFIQRKALEWVSECLSLDTPLADRIRHDLVRMWCHLPDLGSLEWGRLAFLQIGGWDGQHSPSEVEQLRKKQGFLHFDPGLTAPEVAAQLRLRFAPAFPQSPCRPLGKVPIDANLLLRCPIPGGELHFHDQWPLPRPSVALGGVQVDAPTFLPAGMDVMMASPNYPLHTLEREVVGQQNALNTVFRTLWVGQPERLLGSAPALQLALWLREIQFPLRALPKSRVAELGGVLESKAVNYVREDSPPLPTWSLWGSEVLILSPAELAVLNLPRAVEFTHINPFPSLLRQLESARTQALAGRMLLDFALDTFDATSGAVLRFSSEWVEVLASSDSARPGWTSYDIPPALKLQRCFTEHLLTGQLCGSAPGHYAAVAFDWSRSHRGCLYLELQPPGQFDGALLMCLAASVSSTLRVLNRWNESATALCSATYRP